MESNFDNQHSDHKPKLTIAVGAYNDAKFLPGGLDALLAQTFTDFELVISNNASTDETAEIIQEYAEKDSRIRLFRQEKNIGLIGNYNFLRRQARGEFYMWAACDDRCAPRYVETIISGMEKDKSIVLGFTPYQFIDEEGVPFDNIRKFDFSGNNAFVRLLRYFAKYDDGTVYGIYRHQQIKNQDFPIWWGRNANTPLNTGYAFLTYVLAKGKFQLFGEQPLWFNCIKSAEHYQPFKEKGKVLPYLAFFLLRKINVAWVQFQNIQKGSGSILLSLALFPVLILRVMLDAINLIIHAAIKLFMNKSRSFYN